MQTMTYATLTARVAQQARLAREAGVTLNEASAVLAQAEAREQDRQRARYVGSASALDYVSGPITSEVDALAAGTRYVDTWEQEGRNQSKTHAWNTIGHVESMQPLAALFALGTTQYYTITHPDGTVEHVEPRLNRVGKVVKATTSERCSEAGKRSAGVARPTRRKRADGAVMTQAERTALSKWRSSARADGFVCAEHGPSLKGCTTECRTAALDLTSGPAPVQVAVSADRGW